MADKPIPKVISATEASNKFGSMVDEAARGLSTFVITRLGKARAVVLGMEQYRDLLDELEIIHEQNDPDIQAALEEAGKEFELGTTMTLEELDKQFGFTEEEINNAA